MEIAQTQWDNKKLADWKRFWESDMGGIALSKMHQLKDMYVERALRATTADQVSFFTGRAAGVDSVIEDINVGIKAAEDAAEKEEKESKK